MPNPKSKWPAQIVNFSIEAGADGLIVGFSGDTGESDESQTFTIRFESSTQIRPRFSISNTVSGFEITGHGQQAATALALIADLNKKLQAIVK